MSGLSGIIHDSWPEERESHHRSWVDPTPWPLLAHQYGTQLELATENGGESPQNGASYSQSPESVQEDTIESHWKIQETQDICTTTS